jgi:hypothetical protein
MYGQDSLIYTVCQDKFVEKFNFRIDSVPKSNLPLNGKDAEILQYCNADVQKYLHDHAKQNLLWGTMKQVEELY